MSDAPGSAQDGSDQPPSSADQERRLALIVEAESIGRRAVGGASPIEWRPYGGDVSTASLSP